MPGHKPKAQHYVQERYLAAFCDATAEPRSANPYLWVHSAQLPTRKQIPRECAVENYFYCFDQDGVRSFAAEETLAKLEADSGNVLRAAQAGLLPKTIKDRFTLTGYAAMSLVRTQRGRRLIDKAATDSTVEAIREIINDPKKLAEHMNFLEKETGIPHNAEEHLRKLRAGKVRVQQSNRGWSLRTMFEVLESFQSLFMDMDLTLLHARGGEFVTSDSPVRVHNPADFSMLNSQGAIPFLMLFPLSARICLAGSYGSPDAFDIDSEAIQTINQALAREADRFVYSPFKADYISEEMKKASGERPPASDIVQF